MDADISTSLPAELGEQLGFYRLDSVLGQGGASCVYAATHLLIGRKAAVKVLSTEHLADEQYTTRFIREARIIGSVKHPNVVEVYDFIESERPRRVAYVMEMIEGPSLAQVLGDGPLTMMQAINVARQLTSALEAVHVAGVVHRDLKPANVLLLAPKTSDFAVVPSIKVLDFGIAKSSGVHANPQDTVAGLLLGTPAYMAPEQASGEPVSPATDVYALGEILYEMLSGQRAFEGGRSDVLKSKLVGDVPELQLDGLADPATIEEVRGLIRACLAPHPNMRPLTSEVRVALDIIAAQIPDVPGTRRTTSSSIFGRKKLRYGPREKSSRAIPLSIAFGVLLAMSLGFNFRDRQPAVIVEPLPPPITHTLPKLAQVDTVIPRSEHVAPLPPVSTATASQQVERSEPVVREPKVAPKPEPRAPVKRSAKSAPVQTPLDESDVLPW